MQLSSTFPPAPARHTQPRNADHPPFQLNTYLIEPFATVEGGAR
jgi:hypothetical protein